MEIFVGSLPFKLKETELKALFEEYGAVSSATIIINKKTRQNKGFGFVEMPNEAEARKAIWALNGFEVLERKLQVSQAGASPRREKSITKPKVVAGKAAIKKPRISTEKAYKRANKR